MPSCIASLDAIIMCSDHEGTPMTALEALALGTPLIAHDVGGLREILKDSDGRVKNHQPQEYAKFVTRIIEHRLKPEKLLPEFSAITNMKSTLSSYRLSLK
jgi:L-malate glycosyltransferase